MRSRWWSASTTPRGRTCTRRRPRHGERHGRRIRRGRDGSGGYRRSGRGQTGKQTSPAEAAMASLYQQMAGLPPQLQISCGAAPRSWRTSGTASTAASWSCATCWRCRPGCGGPCAGTAPDIPGYENPLTIMDLLYGKPVLMGYEGTELRHRYPPRKRSPARRAARRRGGGRRDSPGGARTAHPVGVRGTPPPAGAVAGGVGPARRLRRETSRRWRGLAMAGSTASR